MRKALTYAAVGAALAGAGLAAGFFATLPVRTADRLLSHAAASPRPGGAVIDAPADGTAFPPDLAAPGFRWHAAGPAPDRWLVAFAFAGGGPRLAYFSDAAEWTPGDAAWRKIVRRCGGRPATVTVLGLGRADRGRPACAASVAFRIAPDPVAAPIFYREVNLPFAVAVKDPSKIRWRMGCVSARQPPPVVLEKLPVCGNCHSFSRDGAVLGMDVDYANDKGSYVTAAVAPEIELSRDKLLSWSDYRREDGVPTFGLLSQVSPNGRYVVSTVKDRSVFLPTPGLEFSQLFFPIQGILAVYDRRERTFRALPGADDPAFVQSNPAWSPDGQTIVFARARAYALKGPVRKDAVLLRREECEEFLSGQASFQYDLYRIPFNGGRGGAAVPLAGASRNGKSNFFPKYSPNGKWIAFCQAASFMLLQPDSELYLMPAAGGEARRMACNLPRMNSWHSWSPNSRWLVFSSKSGTAFTRLFLTHIDERGESTPAVPLARFVQPGRAANIPEFVNAGPAAIRRIREAFIDDVSLTRAGNAFREGGEADQAIAQYRQALALNPASVEALVNLGTALADKQDFAEAAACLRQALARDPANATVHYNLGTVCARQGDFDGAIRACAEAARLDPGSANAQCNLGIFLLEKGRAEEALAHLAQAIRLNPENGNAYFPLGRIMVRRGRLADAARFYAEAVRLAPDERSLNALAWLLSTAPDPALRDGKRAVECATRLCALTRDPSPRALDILGASYAEAGRFPEAQRGASAGAAAPPPPGRPPRARRPGPRTPRSGRATPSSPPRSGSA